MLYFPEIVTGVRQRNILVEKLFNIMAPFFDLQVFSSLVLAELQLFYERPIFQPLGPDVALLSKIVWHYRMQLLTLVGEALFFFYGTGYGISLCKTTQAMLYRAWHDQQPLHFWIEEHRKLLLTDFSSSLSYQLMEPTKKRAD